jgi:2-polyprenyl-3-methyl-5-hydroxy-6-metoxy-1,4-benzoquinol methylase
MIFSLPDLTIRSEAPELMDDLSIGGAELVETLAQLRRINRLLGAAWPTLEGVTRLWSQAGRPRQLSILDTGAGSGELNCCLLRWADRSGLRMRITLLDIHPDTCQVAANYYQNDPRVQVIQGDICRLGLNQVDIVTASLFLHHFPAGRLPLILSSMLRVARLGVVINDLHRHKLAWVFIKIATHLFSQNRLIRHDAPLSVRRGFRAADLEALKKALEPDRLSYRWRPFFRYLMIISRCPMGSA